MLILVVTDLDSFLNIPTYLSDGRHYRQFLALQGYHPIKRLADCGLSEDQNVQLHSFLRASRSLKSTSGLYFLKPDPRPPLCI